MQGALGGTASSEPWPTCSRCPVVSSSVLGGLWGATVPFVLLPQGLGAGPSCLPTSPICLPSWESSAEGHWVDKAQSMGSGVVPTHWGHRAPPGLLLAPPSNHPPRSSGSGLGKLGR